MRRWRDTNKKLPKIGEHVEVRAEVVSLATLVEDTGKEQRWKKLPKTISIGKVTHWRPTDESE